MRLIAVFFSTFVLAFSLPVVNVSAQKAASGLDVTPSLSGKLTAPTQGGSQFWTDELVFRDLRIQRNCFTQHCRLLDGKNRRHAAGAYEKCFAELEEIKRQQVLPAMDGRAVIVLHGLGDSRRTMARMERFLKQQNRYWVFNLSYASTRCNVAQHAAALAHVIAHLEGIEEINFVAHSLGNLVIRHYFGDQIKPSKNTGADPRIKRIVMLAPPNHGVRLAERLGRNEVFRFFAGVSGDQLASNFQQLRPNLAIPECEFGIIAGGRGQGGGRNPLIEGDDDFILRVDETRLVGARDFVVLPVLHTFIMNDARVQEYTARFLEHGYFISQDQRKPISRNEDSSHRDVSDNES